MTRKIFALTVGAVFAFAAGNAQAVLLSGQTVGYTYYYPDLSSPIYQPPDFVVGAGVELPGLFSSSDGATVDVSDTNILVDFYITASFSPGLFNGFRLYDSTASIAPITSVNVNAGTNMIGFSAANVSFDADNIYVNFQGLPFDENTIVSLDINASAVVPAPSSFLTWGAAMAIVAVVAAVRSRRAVAAV